MPAYPRRHQLLGNLAYHVLNRGNARQVVFHDEEDYRKFEGILREYRKRAGIRIYHWALLPDRFHFVLEIEEPERLSKVMAGIQRAYVHYHHRRHDSIGFLWQGRFRSQPVEKGAFLAACGRFMERSCTPSREARPWDWAHSSAPFYAIGKPDTLTDASPVYATLGPTFEDRRIRYQEFLLEADAGKDEALFQSATGVAGSEAFRHRLVRKQGRLIARRRGRAPSTPVPSPDPVPGA
ncbi:MAG: transposase [Planctomycetota bacterium]